MLEMVNDVMRLGEQKVQSLMLDNQKNWKQKI
jgi:hypothetical protein